MNIRFNPTTIISSKMGGAPTPKWDPIGFDPQPNMKQNLKAMFSVYPRFWQPRTPNKSAAYEFLLYVVFPTTHLLCSLFLPLCFGVKQEVELFKMGGFYELLFAYIGVTIKKTCLLGAGKVMHPSVGISGKNGASYFWWRAQVEVLCPIDHLVSTPLVFCLLVRFWFPFRSRTFPV